MTLPPFLYFDKNKQIIKKEEGGLNMYDFSRPDNSPGLLAFIKAGAPKLWESLEHAAALGLIYIDEEHDAVTATNRLLLTYPDLHGVLNQIIDHWSSQAGGGMDALAEILHKTKGTP